MILQIFYERWGGHPADKKFWTSRIKGEVEVYDYGTKEQLKHQAIQNKWRFEVLKHHRDGRVSVIETEKDYKEVLSSMKSDLFKFK